MRKEREEFVCSVGRKSLSTFWRHACLSDIKRFVLSVSYSAPQTAGHTLLWWWNAEDTDTTDRCARVRTCVRVCVCLIWDVRLCRCNNKVHGARQRLPSLPQQHLCCLERERAVKGGGRESNRLSESERVADRFVCSPANSLPPANSFNTKDEWGKNAQNNTGKKSVREGGGKARKCAKSLSWVSRIQPKNKQIALYWPSKRGDMSLSLRGLLQMAS